MLPPCVPQRTCCDLRPPLPSHPCSAACCLPLPRWQQPPAPEPAADFVEEWRDRLREALEAQEQQACPASPAGGTAGAAAGDADAAASKEALRAAELSVMTQFAFGFHTIQAPKASGRDQPPSPALHCLQTVLPRCCCTSPVQPAWLWCAACGVQVLSDVVESLVGAVFVDTGGDMGRVWEVTQVGQRNWGRQRVP